MALRVNSDLCLEFFYALSPFCANTHALPFLTGAGTVRNPHVFATLSPRSCHCCLRARPSSGNVKTISGQFKRSDLCVEHRLNVRTPPLAWPVHASPQLTLWRLDSHEIYARSILGSRTSFPPVFHGAKPSSYILFRTATFPQADHLFIYPVSGKCTTYPSAGQSGCRSFIRHLRIH